MPTCGLSPPPLSSLPLSSGLLQAVEMVLHLLGRHQNELSLGEEGEIEKEAYGRMSEVDFTQDEAGSESEEGEGNLPSGKAEQRTRAMLKQLLMCCQLAKEADEPEGTAHWCCYIAKSNLCEGSLGYLRCVVLCCAVMCCVVLCCDMICCDMMCCVVVCCFVLSPVQTRKEWPFSVFSKPGFPSTTSTTFVMPTPGLPRVTQLHSYPRTVHSPFLLSLLWSHPPPPSPALG
jgi:hypothetical protein